ncbi:hypothetical protein NUH30_19570, partial [Leptospira sp. 85282-16]|uniref:hypothetical protein n=1 Tax=Leptospira sp. 85282-16 TaxID=2971256 RepID=UPI0021C1706C
GLARPAAHRLLALLLLTQASFQSLTSRPGLRASLRRLAFSLCVIDEIQISPEKLMVKESK